jgi:hypothetical protein
VDQARDIYGLKYLASNTAPTSNPLFQQVSSSVVLAAHYGVSSKTIRDIWNRKTWTQTTADIFERETIHTISPSLVQYLDIKVRSMI